MHRVPARAHLPQQAILVEITAAVAQASAEMVLVTMQAAEQAARAAQVVSSRTWAEARKTLRISGTTTVTDDHGRKRQSVIINGLTYGNGDLISVNHEGHRFTWRVQGLTEGATLRLTRLRVKDIEDEEPKGDKK